LQRKEIFIHLDVITAILTLVRETRKECGVVTIMTVRQKIKKSFLTVLDVLRIQISALKMHNLIAKGMVSK